MRILASSLNNNLTMASELVPILNLLVESGISCEYIVENNNPCILEKLKTSKAKVVVLRNNFKENNKIGFRKKIPAILKNFYLLFKTYKDHKKLIAISEKYFDKKVDILIVAGDRHLGIELALIYHAKARNIPIVVPQLAVNDKGFMVRLRSNNNLYKMNFVNKIFSKLYPENVFANYHFYSWGNALALKLLGILPKDPWNIGNSFATKYLAIFNIYKNLAVLNGMDPNKIDVVGQVSFDRLMENYNDRHSVKLKLLNKYFSYNIHINSRIIVFALPQFYEHSLMSKEDSLQEINYLLNELNQLPLPVFVSLHPKMQYADYEFINSNFDKIRVVKDERLNEIICISDLFISCFSSTLPWASLVHSQPIFLDYYNLGLDVGIFPDCIQFFNKDSFRQDIILLLKNNNKNKNYDFNNCYFDSNTKCSEKILASIKSIA